MSSWRGTVAGVTAVLVGLAAAGCSSSSSSAADATSPADRATVVASAVDQVGARRAVMGASVNRQLVRLDLAGQGVTAPEVDCVLATMVPATVGDAGFAQLSVRDADRFISEYQTVLSADVSTKVRACLSPESLARRAAKQLAPDVDVAAARRLLLSATTATGVAVGLTATEAGCYAAKSFESISDAQLEAGLMGTSIKPPVPPGKLISACLSAARISALEPALKKDLDGMAAADAAARARAEAELKAQAGRAVAGALSSSTTVAPTTSTTTTP